MIGIWSNSSEQWALTMVEAVPKITEVLDFVQSKSEVVNAEYLEYQIVFVYFALFFGPLIIVCNLIVTVSSLMMVRTATQPVSVYMFFCNTSIADIVKCASLLFGLLELESLNDKYICASQLGSIISASLTSMLSICLIAVERYLYIVRGKQYDSKLTPGRTGLVILLLWLVGAAFGVVPSLIEAGSMPGDTVQVCEFIGSPLSVVIPAVTLSVLALMITPVAYMAVYRHVKRAAAKMAHNGKIPKIKYKSILVVLLSSISFLVCWGPIMVCVVVYKVYCGPYNMKCHNLEIAVISPLACLAFSNTLLNPVIYAWWHPPYNTALKKVFCPNKRAAKTRGSLLQKPRPTVATIS